jgi:hypothetical protein
MIARKSSRPPDAGHETDAPRRGSGEDRRAAAGDAGGVKNGSTRRFPVDIWELGLIYDVFVTAEGSPRSG